MYRYKDKRHIEEVFKRDLERFIDKDDHHLLFFCPVSFSVYGDLIRRYAAKNDDMLGYRTIVAIQRKVSDERNFDNTICEVSKNFTF